MPPPPTILVLENETLMRRAIVRTLQPLGYTLLQADSRHEALELLRRHTGPVDLLIVDVTLVAVSGPDAARAIQALHPGLRTLFISGGTRPDEGHFLAKPFTTHELRDKVRQLLTPP